MAAPPFPPDDSPALPPDHLPALPPDHLPALPPGDVPALPPLDVPAEGTPPSTPSAVEPPHPWTGNSPTEAINATPHESTENRVLLECMFVLFPRRQNGDRGEAEIPG
jgi:hypothetical protein